MRTTILFGFSVLLAFMGNMPSASARTFFIRSGGNDALSGRNTANAWRSLNNINRLDLDAGDTVLFEAGSTFNGGIYLSAEDSGSTTKPVYFSSYGNGRALIYADRGFGFFAYNVGGIAIHNLDFRGLHPDSSTNTGISFYTDDPLGRKYAYIRLSYLRISGFRNGIQLGSNHRSYPGYSDIIFSHLHVSDNRLDGISTYDIAHAPDTGYGHTQLYIGHCYLNNNGASGLVLGGVSGGLIERVKASRTGQLHNQGIVGIWAWSSRNLTFRHCIADSTRTSGGDGGGFDLDGGTENCVIEYCYAFANDGPGFMHCDYPGSRLTRHNIIRYNISASDGLQPNRDKSSLLYISWGTGLYNCLLHNNTSYIGNKPTGSIAGLQGYILDGFDTAVGLHECKAFNNIVHAGGDSNYLLRIYNGRSFKIDSGDLQFVSNVYFAEKSVSRRWAEDGNTYNSLNSWRNATKQELYQGKPLGWINNPRLLQPGKGIAVSYHQIDSMATALRAYKLQPIAPHIDQGLQLTSGLKNAAADFFGHPRQFGKAVDIGCAEAFYPEIHVEAAGCNNLMAYAIETGSNVLQKTAWSLHPDSPNAAAVYSSQADTLRISGLEARKYYVRCMVRPDTALYSHVFALCMDSLDMRRSWPGLDFDLNRKTLCLPESPHTFFAAGIRNFHSGLRHRWETPGMNTVFSDTLRVQLSNPAHLTLTLSDTQGCMLSKTFVLRTDTVHLLRLPTAISLCAPDSLSLFPSFPGFRGHQTSFFTLKDGAGDTVIQYTDSVFRYFFKAPIYTLHAQMQSASSCSQTLQCKIRLDTSRVRMGKPQAEVCKGEQTFDLDQLEPRPGGGSWLHNQGAGAGLTLQFGQYPALVHYRYLVTDTVSGCSLEYFDSLWVRDTLVTPLPAAYPLCSEAPYQQAMQLFQLGMGPDSNPWSSIPAGLNLDLQGGIDPRKSKSGVYSLTRYLQKGTGCPTLQTGSLEILPPALRLQATLSAREGKAPFLLRFDAYNELPGTTRYTWNLQNANGMVIDTVASASGSYLFNDTGTFHISLIGETINCRDTLNLGVLRISDFPLSSAKNTVESTLRLYPNPVQALQTVLLHVHGVYEPIKFYVYNAQGAKIAVYAVQQPDQPLQIQAPGPGVYYIQTDQILTPLKWVVE